jgi:hypothetical protein
MLKMDFHVCDSNVHGSFIQTIPFDERHIYWPWCFWFHCYLITPLCFSLDGYIKSQI